MLIHRVFTRTYVYQPQLEAAVRFYEELTGQPCGLRFDREDLGLRVAVVGWMHVVAGAESGMYDYPETRATFLVDRVDSFIDPLTAMGAEVLHDPIPGPQGHTMHVRHPDGLVVEYVDGETE